MDRRLNTFLCYSSYDYVSAKTLYKRLSAYQWIKPWLEFGADWKKSIDGAVNGAHVVIILISKQSISKRGYSQEIFERTIELIKENRKKFFCVVPLKLDDCVPPQGLQHLEWRDYSGKNAHEGLINSLSKFTGASAVYATKNESGASYPNGFPVQNPADTYENLDWYKYIKIPPSSKVNYPFLIRKFHVTNEQYLLFQNSKDYTNDFYWKDFPKYDEHCNHIGNWGDAGLVWLKKVLKYRPSLLEERSNWTWDLSHLGTSLDYDYRQPNHHAQVSWFEANAYCKWFSRHWRDLSDAKELSDMITISSNLFVRLPLETEFHVAVKHDDLTRVEIDPTLRLFAKRHPGLSLDISATDMLASCYGEVLLDSLVSCDGYLYIDEYTRDLARVSYYGTFRAEDAWNRYGFRMVITEV